MRFFLVITFVIGLLIFAGLRTPKEPTQFRVLRTTLFIAAGVFGALLLSAMLQALFNVD
jgi:hypothetical protein